jgi:hypothetical protein
MRLHNSRALGSNFRVEKSPSIFIFLQIAQIVIEINIVQYNMYTLQT